MEESRLEISPLVAEHMAYAKFGSGSVRLLVLEGTYWVDQACARAASAMGWHVTTCPVNMIGTMSRDMLKELFAAILHHRPDFVLSVNLSGMDVDGMLARFLADLKLPHATWFVDNPRTIMAGHTASATPYTMAFSWEPAYHDFLRACGFPEVHALPLGVDETIFRKAPSEAPTHPPAFVGDSMIYHAEKAWAEVAAIPGLNPILAHAFAEGRVTREGFAHGVDAILGSPRVVLDQNALYHTERLFFIEGTRRLRHGLVNALAPLGLLVHGDVHWKSVTDQWGPPLEYVTALGEYYQNCPVNLNTTSVQMANAVNQRVFDCPAAGGFLLTDAQAQLETLFDQDEIVTYRDWKDASEKLQWFLAHPSARKEIIKKAQRRILGEHTYQHRLATIRDHLQERFGG